MVDHFLKLGMEDWKLVLEKMELFENLQNLVDIEMKIAEHKF
jgi:hypothetical protein